MSVKKNCSRLTLHRAHEWHSERGIFLCAGLTHEAQNPLYASTPYYPLPSFITEDAPTPVPVSIPEPYCAPVEQPAQDSYSAPDSGSSPSCE